MDNFEEAEGATAEFVRSFGVRSSVGTPIVVEGRFWGLMTAGSMEPEPLPAGTEWRIAEFTELVATAISNAEARQELERVAGEQAALGRVATLVAEAVPSREVFAAVAAEVAGLFSVPLVGLFRYETASTATLIAGSGKLSPYLGRSWNFPADDQSLLATLQRTGRPLRVDDYSKVTGAGVEIANELDVGAAVGVPVIVDGRVWGAVALGVANDRPPLPTDTVDRVTDFTDLIGTAIANAEARTEVGRLAEEQAALRRVATLVARGVQPAEAFAASRPPSSSVTKPTRRRPSSPRGATRRCGRLAPTGRSRTRAWSRASSTPVIRPGYTTTGWPPESSPPRLVGSRDWRASVRRSSSTIGCGGQRWRQRDRVRCRQTPRNGSPTSQI
jgi:GAF domain-containing protein